MELKITGTPEEVAGFIAATRDSPFAGAGETKTVVLEVNGHELGRAVVPAVQPKEEIVSPMETTKKAYEEAIQECAQQDKGHPKDEETATQEVRDSMVRAFEDIMLICTRWFRGNYNGPEPH